MRLNPETVATGPVAAAQLARLEMLAGTKLTQVGMTRTGALEFSLAEPSDAAALKARLRAMRQERSVLWAEPAPARLERTTTRTGSASGHGYVDTGHKLMVRIKGDPAPDWATLLVRFGDQIGAPVIAERRIGNVWVLGLMKTVNADALGAMAARLQADPAVQYADPVLRRFPRFVPNDPYFAQQWALTDPVGGINVQSAWDLQLQSPAASTTIALIDTGILQHPDLNLRILPGYDFITDASQARDGNARDSNPRDEGDWRDDGGCGGFPASSSSWHGTFVSGIMAGDINNGIGMAGVDLFAQIVPVRVLGECGGTDEDVFEGMLWASGVQVDGIAPNPFPAKVINMSLGGFGSDDGNCGYTNGDAMHQAICRAVKDGVTFVVAAGNSSWDLSQQLTFVPASYDEVITVSALDDTNGLPCGAGGSSSCT